MTDGDFPFDDDAFDDDAFDQFRGDLASEQLGELRRKAVQELAELALAVGKAQDQAGDEHDIEAIWRAVPEAIDVLTELYLAAVDEDRSCPAQDCAVALFTAQYAVMETGGDDPDWEHRQAFNFLTGLAGGLLNNMLGKFAERRAARAA